MSVLSKICNSEQWLYIYICIYQYSHVFVSLEMKKGKGGEDKVCADTLQVNAQNYKSWIALH